MSKEKLDESYEGFLTEFKKDENCIKIDDKVEADLQGVPEELIYIWKKHGICSYDDGLWWHTNPRDFDEIAQEWLEGTKYWQPETNPCHVIGRSAFGKLYLWSEKTGSSLMIDPLMGAVYHLGSEDKEYIDEGKTWVAVSGFLTPMDQNTFDYKDNKGKPLFERVHKKLGTLKYNEMYTAVPAPIFSGGISVKNAQKEDLFIQMSILRQLIDEPKIIDFEVFDRQLGL
jgi:hypothetical protein